MIRSLLIAGLAMVLCVTAINPVAACPLCLAPARTWAETIADADVVVLAELVSADEGSDQQRPSAWLRIVKVHRGHGPWTSRPGSVVRIREAVFGEPGDTFLLHATEAEADSPVLNETFASVAPSGPESAIQQVSAAKSDSAAQAGRHHPSLNWNLPEPASPTFWQYIVNAPPPELDVRERLPYFLDYLEHTEESIAVDAWGEFAKAEYAAIKSLHAQFAKDRLRTWIADADTSPERLNLFGLMLGMCGDEGDADFIRDQIGPVRSQDIRFGTEGLMAGLLMLAGESGLSFLEETRLQPETTPIFEVMAVVQALQFAWNHETDLINRDRLRRSLRPLLQHDEMREIVVIDLARWQDWQTVDQLPALYQQVKSDDPRSVSAIIGFVLTLQKPDSGASGDQRTAAASLLQQIRQDSPALVKRVERQFR